MKTGKITATLTKTEKGYVINLKDDVSTLDIPFGSYEEARKYGLESDIFIDDTGEKHDQEL